MFVAACVPRSALTPTPSNLPPSITPLPASVTPATSSTQPDTNFTTAHSNANRNYTIFNGEALLPGAPSRRIAAHLSGYRAWRNLCWGDNYFGQLGDGTDFGSWKTITPLGLSSVVTAIGSGGGHVCALLENGGVRCWGDNSAGQVGDGTITGK